jgi:hypothetical protein
MIWDLGGLSFLLSFVLFAVLLPPVLFFHIAGGNL